MPSSADIVDAFTALLRYFGDWRAQVDADYQKLPVDADGKAASGEQLEAFYDKHFRALKAKNSWLEKAFDAWLAFFEVTQFADLDVILAP